jgi:hypothetical protein
MNPGSSTGWSVGVYGCRATSILDRGWSAGKAFVGEVALEIRLEEWELARVSRVARITDVNLWCLVRKQS